MNHNEILEFALETALAAGAAAGILQIFRLTRVVGISMEPNFHQNDCLLIERQAYRKKQPVPGDVIVFRSQLKDRRGRRKYFLKRVIAVPGDEVNIRDGKVFVNGMEQDESFTFDRTTEQGFEGTVPERCVFCLGDNRQNSMDSRSPAVGYVPFSEIIGRITFRVFPPGKIGRIDRDLRSNRI